MRRFWIDHTFMLPALLIFTIFLVYPVLSSFYYSFTDWNGFSQDNVFIGLKNFQKMIHDKDVWNALYKTVIFAFFSTLLQNVLGLILALAVDGTNRIFHFFRVLYLIPSLLSALAIGFIWSYMFSPVDGVINTLLTNSGLASWTQDWLGNPHWAMVSVIFTGMWQWVGFNMIIFLAGLQSVPAEVNEAARIDGAGKWKQFIHVTFPLIAPAFTVSMVITLIGSFKVFDVIYVMTKGGPGSATESIAIYLYKTAFNMNEMGYGTAIAIVMFIIILGLSILQLSFLRKREVEA